MQRGQSENILREIRSNSNQSLKDMGKNKEREGEMKREGYKDRVKRQRLAGQSGIGEDFRSWRTDEEMRLRQQFD